MFVGFDFSFGNGQRGMCGWQFKTLDSEYDYSDHFISLVCFMIEYKNYFLILSRLQVGDS